MLTDVLLGALIALAGIVAANLALVDILVVVAIVKALKVKRR